MKRLYIAAALVLACAMVFTSCGFFELTLGTPKPTEGKPTTSEDTGVITDVPVTGDNLLRVTFIDVGQGDSSFIEFPNGECMLIDAAEKEEADKIIRYIKKRGYNKIDYLILTHPHADHMGGMVDVINAFDIGVFYMTNAISTTSAFEEILDTVERENITLKRSMAGINIISGDGYSANFLSPVSEEYDDLNNYSSVVKLTMAEYSFLFMGDAEKLAEDELTGDLGCNVVKIGHHGSRTSSSDNFVKKTGADFAVISVGEANRYGHPNSEIVTRWEKIGARILRTDVQGNIIFTTNGKAISLQCEKGSSFDGDVTLEPDATDNVTPDATPSYYWILNISSKKIHKPDCSGVKTMSEANKEQSSKTLEELYNEGYTACGICKPEE